MEHRRKQDKQKNLSFVITLGISILLAILILFVLRQRSKFFNSLGLYIKGHPYYLEIALDNQKRKIGLSNRNELCRNCGMLFVFDTEAKYPIWMKDTHFPLDIVWLNSKQEIVKIIVAAPIDSETTYINQDPAKYVIELPANETLKLNLQIGDTIPILGNDQ